MILTGGMCLVADGSTIQTLSALVVSFFYMMFVLKTGPFLHDNDDMLSFVTSLQLVFTFLGALILQMDQAITTAENLATQGDATETAQVNAQSVERFDREKIGIFLIVINVMCLCMMVLSLMAALSPLFKEYCCKKKKKKKSRKDTKVKPKKDSVAAASDAENAKNWSDWSEDSGATAGTATNNLMVKKTTEPPALNLGDGPFTKSRQGLKRKKTTRQELRDVRKEYGTESKEYQSAINNMR